MDLGLKVIVAEDNSLQRMILSSMVESLGYQAVPAEDGQQALDLVCTTNAQIILSDFHMPILNGVELTRKVRALELGHYVHIIMITGRDEDNIRAEALEAGVDDFLTKGQSPLIFQTRIRSASRLVHHAAALAETTRALRETHAQIEQDLQAAANAQRQLLPAIHELMLGFRISAKFIPSSIVSGDMFGCFPLSDTELGFYAVDVSGHGVHASLLSVAIGHLITPDFFGNRVLANSDRPDPAALVTDLNNRFSVRDNDDYFTMFCGVVNKLTGRLDYCQAAYPSPLYVRTTSAVEAIGDGGFPVGMFPQVDYENSSLDFKCGDSLIICSDAVPEAQNGSRIPFGNARLQSIVSQTPQFGICNLPDRIVRALDDWRDGRALEDDLTIVALERTESNDPNNRSCL